MTDHSVEVKPAAQKELEALPDNVLARVIRKTRSPASNTTAYGMQKAERLQRSMEIPIGDGHVVYVIDDAAKLISVMRIAYRREVYE